MRAIPAAALLLILAFTAPAVSAQPAQETPAAPAASATAAAESTSQHIVVPPASEKAMQYYRSGNVLWVILTLWGLAVPILLLFTGFSVRMRNTARKVGRNWFFTVGVYAVLYSLVGVLLGLPLDWYRSFVRPHAYGLSSQTAAKWWSHQLIGIGVGCAFAALTLWFPYLLLRKSPKRWWLYTGLATVPLLSVFLLVKPIWIDPLFNKFGPMKDKALEAEILALADRAEIEGSRVEEIDKSVDTKTVNAYVTGFLSTKRIILWDTILAKLDKREILFVIGHEMGHYVLSHTWQLIAMASSLALFGLWVIHRTAQALTRRFQDRFGFSELSDVASAPLMAVLYTLVTLLLTPVVMTVSRYQEHEADRFGLEITRDNSHCGTAFGKLQSENLDNPRPGLFYKLWRSSHPPIGERIDFCNQYRPWETGEPLRYGNLIRGAS